MKRFNFSLLLSSLLLTLLIGFCTNCSDDDCELLTNGAGSTLEIVGEYRISTFSLNNEEIWELPDSVKTISIDLFSLADSTELSFKTQIIHTAEQRKYGIMIPKDEQISDGLYLMRGYDAQGVSLGRTLEVSFNNEMVKSILSVSVDYKLKGKGTEVRPYLIKSAEDFNQFCKTLSVDENHAFGLYFRQEVPTLEITRSHNSDSLNFTFAGHYDGNNNKVELNLSGIMKYGSALFPQLADGAAISSLKIDCFVNEAGNYTAAIAGKATGHIFLKGISTSGSIIAKEDEEYGQYIAGLIGYMKGGDLTVSNCVISGKIEGRKYVGGVVGLFDDGHLFVDNVRNNETEKVYQLIKMKGSDYVGYIAGCVSNAQMTLNNVKLIHTLTDGKAISNITCSGKYLGGLVGSATLKENSSINENTEVIMKMDGNSYIGGFIGELTMKNSATFHIDNSWVEKIEVNNENNEDEDNKENKEEEYIGGLIGKANIMEKSTLKISNENIGVQAGDINGKKYVGGLFGSFQGSLSIVDPITVNTNVKAVNYGAGGLFGELKETILDVSDKYLLNSKIHISSNEAVGGLVGEGKNVTIEGNIISNLNFPKISKISNFKPVFSGFVENCGEEGKAIGGIIGHAEYCTIKNVCFDGSVSGIRQVGGIAGYALFTSFENCVNNAYSLIGTQDCIGGIVGELTGKDPGKGKIPNITFRNLINYSNIKDGTQKCGGIVGYCCAEWIGRRENLVFDYMVNLGEISIKNDAGGCIGYIIDTNRANVREEWSKPEEMPKVIFQNSANFGDVSTSGAGCAGGILGGNLRLVTPLFRYCVNRGKISVNTSKEKEDTWGGGITAYLGEESADAGTSHIANGHLEECCNFGEIISTYDDARVGGLVGEKEEGHKDNPKGWWIIKDSYNCGKVTGNDVGSIAGYVDRHNILRNCLDLSNTGNDNEPNNMVGDHKLTDKPDYQNCYILIDSNVRTQTLDNESSVNYCSSGEMKDKNHLKGLDFVDIWIMESDKYPHLKNCPFELTMPE